MTQWIEMLNTKQDGSPVTRRIKIPEIDGDIWFTTNAYAEVANDVGDLLASNIDEIQKVPEPADPGTYYGDEGENVTIKVVGIEDGEYDNLTVLRAFEAESVHTDRLHTDRRDAEVVISKNDAGEIEVDGPDGEISFSGQITDAIQAAHDAAPSEGWHIHIAAGRYDIAATETDPLSDHIVIDKPVTLSGAGYATHLRVKDNTTDSGDGISLIGMGAGATGAALTNFRIDGNQQNNGGEGDGNTILNSTDGHNVRVGLDTGGPEDATIRGVWSVNSTGDGFEPTQSSRVTIQNCVLRDNWEQNVHFNGCDKATLSGCILDGEYNNASIHFYTSSGQVSENITISDCVIVNGSSEGIKIDPGEGSVRNVVIDDSVTIEGFADEGVLITGDSAAYDNPPENITVNAKIRECLRGIKIAAGSDIKFAGEAKRNDELGIYVDANLEALSEIDVSNAVSKNNGVSSESQGILVRARSNSVSDSRFVGNHVAVTDSDADMGIGIQFAVDSGSFENVRAYDNDIDGARVSPTQGYSDIAAFKGEATISSGSTSTTVTHNLGKDPANDRIHVTPISGWVGSAASKYEVPVGSITSTSFDITVDADPTQNVVFSWWIRPEG